MSTEADAQKDLALNTDDAENVVGGRALKKKAKKHMVHHPAAHAGPNINIQGPVTSTPYVDSSDCDPGEELVTMPESVPANSDA